MYSFPNLEPVRCSMSVSNCCFLTCIQISQEAGEMVWYSHLLKNFLQLVVIHTVKGFSIVSEAEGDIFLEFSCFLCEPADVGSLFSASSVSSKSSFNIWKFSVHVLLKPSLESLSITLLHVKWVQLCSSLKILWHCLSLSLEWKLNFSSLVAIPEFSKFAGILSAALSQHHVLGFEIAHLDFHHLHYLCS